MSGARGTADEVSALPAHAPGGRRSGRWPSSWCPRAVAFLALGNVIVSALYQTGEFGRSDSNYVWGILAGLGGRAPGLDAGPALRLRLLRAAGHAHSAPLRHAPGRPDRGLRLVRRTPASRPARSSAPMGRGRAHGLGGRGGVGRVRAAPAATRRTHRAHRAAGRAAFPGSGRRRVIGGGGGLAAVAAARGAASRAARGDRARGLRGGLPPERPRARRRRGAHPPPTRSSAAGRIATPEAATMTDPLVPAPALARKLDTLPDGPGVYLWKDAAGAVLYVGKAKRLRSRVRSYFLAATTRRAPRSRLLVRHIADVETIVVPDEVQSLLLENNLIKDVPAPLQRPAQGRQELSVDRRHREGAVSARARHPAPGHAGGTVLRALHRRRPLMRRSLALIRRIFTVRSCTDDIPRERRERPCLDYHIGRCKAPCVGWQDRGRLPRDDRRGPRLPRAARRSTCGPRCATCMTAASERTGLRARARTA